MCACPRDSRAHPLRLMTPLELAAKYNHPEVLSSGVARWMHSAVISLSLCCPCVDVVIVLSPSPYCRRSPASLSAKSLSLCS